MFTTHEDTQGRWGYLHCSWPGYLVFGGLIAFNHVNGKIGLFRALLELNGIHTLQQVPVIS
jgi:hypothetical protein